MSQKETTLSKVEIERIVDEMISKKKTIKTKIYKIVYQNQIINVIEYQNFINLALFSLNTRRELVKRFLLKTFKNSSIITIDGIEIHMSERSASKVSRLTYNHQQEIALFSDNLIQIAKYKNQEKSRKEKVGMFRYYDSYIFIEEILFKAELNIFVDANGCRLYDINKISQVDARSYEGYGSSEINNIVNDSSLKNNSHKDKK